jgi:hypothetical protein
MVSCECPWVHEKGTLSPINCQTFDTKTLYIIKALEIAPKSAGGYCFFKSSVKLTLAKCQTGVKNLTLEVAKVCHFAT